MNNQPQKIRMKHTGSTAADLEIQYRIDEAGRVVELQTEAFDSALFADFFTRVLKQRNGLDVIRDDRTEWNPKRPPYRVWLTMNRQRYEVTAHRLMQETGGGVAVILRPDKLIGELFKQHHETLKGLADSDADKGA